tara:strand:- start:713 stop:850 length:138 start_codon:yes stop_codon:yes gene_type:complete
MLIAGTSSLLKLGEWTSERAVIFADGRDVEEKVRSVEENCQVESP